MSKDVWMYNGIWIVRCSRMIASTGSAVKIYILELQILGSVKRYIFQTLIQFAVIWSVLYQQLQRIDCLF